VSDRGRLSGGRARHTAGLLALVATLSLSACFGGGDDEAEGASDGGKSSIPVVEIGDDGTVQGAVATISRPTGKYEVTADVLRLKRLGKVLRLEFAVTPRSQGASDSLSPNFFSASYRDVSGITLIDTAALREYRPLQTSGKDSKCVCSRDLSGFTLDTPTVLFADFPVPPEGVKEVTITFPGLGPVAGVPVS
jgi:hypothetical protein